ncbi:MAG: cobyric acid synthase CobQ [Dehalococcoidia bacterium]|nr:cobyric acid synthase CobQ [Dehalococcoidia bacterium]
MKAKVLMVQGTASHVGKSILVAALCRIFRQDGIRVAPFKAQNMSLNSFVTPDGGEIGRAQAVQAEAAGIPPSVEMNPILLKTEADNRSQVVVMGKPLRSASATEYYQLKTILWPKVMAALDKLRSEYELVVIEGAGGPAEVNLKRDEIVNMRVARYARAPVLLVGDIERGGVFASLLGTLELLEPAERKLVKALVINKFRGDLSILEPGLKFLEERTGLPVAGVVPYFHDIHVAEEDAVALDGKRPYNTKSTSGGLDIAVLRLPHLSNFDDFDPLEKEKDVVLRYVSAADEMGHPDLIIIPGTKTTMADLDWLEQRGLARSLREEHRKGTPIVGICGGYQMLGERILDPGAVESSDPVREGLGLLPVTTTFSASKETHQVKGKVDSGRGLLLLAGGLPVEGYEIHMGATRGAHGRKPFAIRERSGRTCKRADGCLDSSGQVLGTYIHGLFHNEELRRAILKQIAGSKGRHLEPGPDFSREAEYDKLAELIRRSLNMELIYEIAGLRR